jgi:hypothetical protein
MSADTFIMIGIASLEFLLAGVYASVYNWPMFGAWTFFGCATLCLAVR